MIQFQYDTPKGKKYSFSTRSEEQAFRLFWQMGFITEPNETWGDINYHGWIIEPIFLYTNGKIDAHIYEKGAEYRDLFRGTVQEAKQLIDDENEERYRDWLRDKQS